ncbi:hypothetical protein CANTEDRAFT_116559 [Yamadazyma tenuis ATCC 10573]|uniref:Nonsense-mediated decay protein 4 n=1 Tax=Candida tenuis (strain ATCC 10573 / BCRC 21748 / CBS 615 / JCM 9827 / NBRC 10315 / NRRL Y-1498 / VKM Y-70) TaxID=590646 RepID=G3BEA2_CANTC|nr:uncharacterized protein CANTEDRAFT_116559 [Yamadazyma tenuis ATCC 10573]EGV60500.1 hypothetical protein CANTEDRAFT_116559 [Yamadazyma tenuis ATCC 10573]
MSALNNDDPGSLHHVDELVGPTTQSLHSKDDPQPTTKRINLILDPSAFTKGIGNIKRWYKDEYIQSRSEHIKDTKVILNLYIPSYTLHEFDYLQRGTSMTAFFARKSIRFIDELYENNQTSQDITPKFQVNLSIEAPFERGPRWKDCQEYQVIRPKVKDFPNFKTKFDSSLARRKAEDFGDLTNDINTKLSTSASSKVNDIQYENSESFSQAAATSEDYAQIPAKLRYLVSSCIFKKFIQPNDFTNVMEEWKVVSEDAITQVWMRSFGVDAMNVNEAELLIFKSYDVNRLFNPHKDFTLEDNVKPNSIFQEIIDTSEYRNKELGDPFRGHRSFRKRSTKKDQPNQIEKPISVDACEDPVTQQSFDYISYAPRKVEGELWKAPNDTSSRSRSRSKRR